MQLEDDFSPLHGSVDFCKAFIPTACSGGLWTTCFPVREGFGVVSSTSHAAAGKVPIPDRFSQQNFRTTIVVR